MSTPDELDIIGETPDDRRAILRGKWRPEYRDRLLASRVRALNVKDVSGFSDRSIDFLRDLDFLTRLYIDSGRIESIEPIYSLKNLELFGLMHGPPCKLRFAELPRLKVIWVHWRHTGAGIFDATQLRHLILEGFPDRDLRRFEKMRNLRALEMSGGPLRSLDGLADLVDLRYLGLVRFRKLASLRGVEARPELTSLRLSGLSQLTSLAGIEALTKLETLNMAVLKRLRNIEPVAALKSLRILGCENCGTLPSASPIAGLSQLRVFNAAATVFQDPDLSFMRKMPSLRHFRIALRRHYVPSVEQLEDEFQKNGRWQP
jgi:Leucine-rich repeat (LRR) protein